MCSDMFGSNVPSQTQLKMLYNTQLCAEIFFLKNFKKGNLDFRICLSPGISDKGIIDPYFQF